MEGFSAPPVGETGLARQANDDLGEGLTTFSPDGARIIFENNRNGSTQELHTMNSNARTSSDSQALNERRLAENSVGSVTARSSLAPIVPPTFCRRRSSPKSVRTCSASPAHRG